MLACCMLATGTRAVPRSDPFSVAMDSMATGIGAAGRCTLVCFVVRGVVWSLDSDVAGRGIEHEH